MIPARWRPALAGLGMGGAQVGNLHQAMSDDDARACVDAAWAAGVRYFDTAPHYGLGLSERRLGAALARYPREEFVLSTKVGRLLRPRAVPLPRDDEGFDVPGDRRRERDYSAAGTLRSIEESLERLGLDRIDVAYVHDPDDHFEAALADAVPALRRLREEGVIGAWGVGMNQAEMLAEFARRSDPDLLMLAGRFTLLEQAPATTLLPVCRERGIGVVAVGVFNSGILAEDRPPDGALYDYAPAEPALIERARAIADVCARHEVSLPAAAMAFPRTDPAVVNVTVGMATPAQVRRNATLAATPVPDALWDDLRDAGLIGGEEP